MIEYILWLFSWSMLQTNLVSIQVPDLNTRQGETSILSIVVKVKQGYHIQANQVKNEYLVPTTLYVEGNENITTGKAIFPEPRRFRLGGSNEWMNVFDGDFEINVTITTSKSIQRGRYRLKAAIHYQACDDKTCFAPKASPFTILCVVK